MVKTSLQGLLMQGSPVAIRMAGRVPSGRKALARRAVDGSANFVSRSETFLTGRKRPAGDRSSKIALLVLDNVPGGERALAEYAIEQGLANAGFLERIASRCITNGDLSSAVRFRRAALDLEPNQPHRYLSLVSALSAKKQNAAVDLNGKEEPLGSEEIAGLLEQALELSEGLPDASYKLGRRLLKSGGAGRSSVARKWLARLAAEGSDGFVSPIERQVTGRQLSDEDRASELAQRILEESEDGVVALADCAIDHGLENAGFLERVALRCVEDGDIPSAVRFRRAALELESDQAHRYFALAMTLGAEKQSEIVYTPLVGLSRGEDTPHTEEIVELLEKALELSPGQPHISYELGSRLLTNGNAARGLRLLEKATLKSPRKDWLKGLAQAYRRPDVANFGNALSTYEQVYRKDPKDLGSLAGIVHAGARGPMDWQRIWRNVQGLETTRKSSPYKNPQARAYLDLLFEDGELFDRGDVASLLDILGSLASSGRHLHPHTQGLVILRLQFMGHFAAGFALRTRLAENRAQNLRRTGIKGVKGLRELMKALVYLDEFDEASGLADDPDYWSHGNEAEKLAVRKLYADAELMRGNVEPYFRYSIDVRKELALPAESKMIKLVKGKRVALVGPAATGDELGAAIDQYDVVVRPNFQPQFVKDHPETMGSRTDAAYYSGQDMTRLIDDVETLIKQSDVQVVNTRSFSFSAHRDRNLPWLRFARQDWALSFHGSPLGIQRMIYDLLQFRPKEIGIFNSDFYTGSGEFAEGYREKRSFGPGSFMNDLVVVHDLFMDFKFTQAMLRTGRVRAHGRAAEVLQLEPDEYLKAVENAGVLQ